MKLIDVASSPQVLRLGLLLSKYIPPKIFHHLAWTVAGIVVRFKTNTYRNVRTNLRQVLGPEVDAQVLEDKTRRVFYTALSGYYDLFRALQLSPADLTSTVHITEEAKHMVQDLKERQGGSVLIFPHLSAFDLGGLALSPYAPEVQALTLANPSPGFQMLNEMRRSTGASVTPLSTDALRQALKLLRRGGTVVMAGDLPVSNQDEPVPFFGQPARVPSGHVRLALKTGAVVALCYCVFSPERERYVMHVEPPMEMIRTGDRVQEIRLNMERVLGALETVIRRWPEQWQMFAPVWPQLMETQGEH